MQLTTLQELFLMQINDIYSVERQLIDAFPLLVHSASDAQLQDALREHAATTRDQLERLDSIYSMLEFEPGMRLCKAMEGLIEEALEAIGSKGSPAVKDAALISILQRIEHHEIAAYGSLAEYAHMLGWHEVGEMLEESLDEEAWADEKFTEVATDHINLQANEGVASA